ncbi:MAG: bifunctional alpha,alpha-trehalose-phosphate synthase (UDP-forming)/trehalose-phosphatase [Gammaproteobacteria bacterium]
MNSRMVIVSNRLPITVSKTPAGKLLIKQSSGGLVAGLGEIHQGSKALWIGHSGVFPSDPGYSNLKAQLTEQRLISVDLSEAEYEAYYNGACNSTIWPLFHYFPETAQFKSESWQAYQAVNQKFAETVLANIKPTDQVWVHDYQLMLLPGLLREAMPNLSIAYFHHIPFPSSEVFCIMRSRIEVLKGLLGADIIGFHTYDYLRHFLVSVTRLLGCSSYLNEIHYRHRRIRLIAEPLGVDVRMIQQQKEPNHKASSSKLMTKLNDQIVMLGIDRLDYTKGIPERLFAFKQFLKKHPEFVGKVTLIQICVPSRIDLSSYKKIRAQVERLVGEINGEFGSPTYTPIHYLYRSFPPEDIIRFYKLAHIALVTPLRDGLNLVCKEYVAARSDKDGIVILSEMAGAAAEMGEAILVNPYDIDSVVQAIYQAVTMPPEERKNRMEKLRKRIIQFDNLVWMRSFMESWKEAVRLSHAHSVLFKTKIQEKLYKIIENSRRSFIFLDYDLLKKDKKLLRDCEKLFSELLRIYPIELTLISDKSPSVFPNHLTKLPLNLVAEHGAMIRLNHAPKKWQAQVGVDDFLAVESDVNRLIENYSQHVPSAHIEHKPHSLIWSYKGADVNAARELFTALGHLLENTHFSVLPGKKSLEVHHRSANKGYAVEYVLRNLHWGPEDVLITIGDNTTDEEMYRVFPQYNIPIHVGRSNLFARYHLNGLSELYTWLSHLNS